jgi:FMN reductase
MEERSLIVISAGLGNPSSTRLLADSLTSATTRSLRAAGLEIRVEVVELRALATELSHHLSGLLGPALGEAMERVAAADGLIVVSPIFNASYSGLFKMFFDALDPDALRGKPVLIAATAGTARHSLALEHAMRPLFVYLKAIVMPTSVFAASEDWGPGGDISTRRLSDRISQAGDELAAAMRSVPAKGPTDPYATTFADLLGSTERGSVGGGDVDVVGVVDEVGPALPVDG